MTLISYRRIGSFSAAAFLLVAAGTTTAAADVVVLESRAPGLQRGQQLADSHRLVIPFGTRLIVAVRQRGEIKTVEIKGRRTGTVADLLKPEHISTRLFKMIIALARTGGAGESAPAAARGARLMVGQVPVLGSRTICVEEGRLPRIALAAGVSDASIRIVDSRGAARPVTIKLSGSNVGKSWPATVPMRDRGFYRLVEQGHAAVELTVRTVPNGTLRNPGSVRSLEQLADRDCTLQVDLALLKAFSK